MEWAEVPPQGSDPDGLIDVTHRGDLKLAQFTFNLNLRMYPAPTPLAARRALAAALAIWSRYLSPVRSLSCCRVWKACW